MSRRFVCPCETCKAERAERSSRAKARAHRRKAEAARRDALEALTPMQRQHMRIGEYVVRVTSRYLDRVWTSADGRVTRLQGMSDAHLLFAAAKMCREGRIAAEDMLKSEILRRLAQAFYPQSYREPNAAGNYRDPHPGQS